jgi:hypothetical protein
MNNVEIFLNHSCSYCNQNIFKIKQIPDKIKKNISSYDYTFLNHDVNFQYFNKENFLNKMLFY